MTTPARWRSVMTPKEARELEAAKQARDAARGRYKATYERLKNRCLQRLRRQEGK